MAGVDEDLWSEGSMEPIGYVMLQFDPCQWTLVNLPCIQNHKLSAVGLWGVELYQHIAIIFSTHFMTPPAKTRNKHWFTDTAMGVPDLAVFMMHVMLQQEQGDKQTNFSHMTEQAFSLLWLFQWHVYYCQRTQQLTVYRAGP